MPFVTQLYKKNQKRISGHRLRLIENLCLLLMANLIKYRLLRLKINLIYNVINKIYYRRPRGTQKRGARSNCYICYYLLIRHWKYHLL